MGGSSQQRRKSVRVSLDYDSEQAIVFAKTSARILDGLAKIKMFCQGHFQDEEGNWANPTVTPSSIGVFCKNLFLDYDFTQKDTLAGFNLTHKNNFVSYKQALSEGTGHLLAKTWLPSDSDYQLEIEADLSTKKLLPLRKHRNGSEDEQSSTYDIRTTLDFPHGRLFHATSDRPEEEDGVDGVRGFGAMFEKRFSAFTKGKLEYTQSRNRLLLKYFYKDNEVTFKPTLSLPSNQLILTLKRKTEDGHKLSLLYSPQETAWEGVYKYRPESHKFKFKAGYNSNAATSFFSLWVGDEGEGARKGPFQTKGQIMLQYDHSSGEKILMYTVKKRWDFL